MFKLTQGNISINVSYNGVPSINPLEHKCVNTIRSIQVIPLSCVIMMYITILKKLFIYHFGKKPLLNLNMKRPTLRDKIFFNGIYLVIKTFSLMRNVSSKGLLLLLFFSVI